ncbi:T9SS type A sorting domain-containing protein [Flavobacterium sp. ZB4R12]|uniref:type IX secretion system anionic LPS delivery protein PorZ n=1 Tax=Flavobacterium sp. ZB4R12 TaxID=3398732 RepID=UPI003AACB062
MQIMKKGVLCFLLLLFIQMGFAQSNLLWQGYFSYNEIKDVSESTTAVFAASENALFSKNITTSQIKTTNTIDGLSGQTISASYHSATFNKTIVGYENGLKVLKSDGQWQSYAMDTILDSAIDNNFGTIAIDKNGTKWLSTSSDGVIGFNESGNKFKKITTGPDTGNLPIADVRTVAVDTRNQLWIGTTKGLRVLSNVGSFQTEDKLTANPIIILEDNLAQELLYEQFITDIAVDGANNKWIGTADSGVFLVSPNGQETKYHFTINNSPLPSNDINDIDINSTTGEVFIATAKGLVSFKGVSTAANDDLSNAYVYPNPVRPEYQGTVKIAGLLDKANIKITDIEGNLVYETTSEGGTIEWDTTAFGKHKVASGVYMIFISAQDGVETKVKKVMIIR